MWFDESVVYQIYPLGLCGAPGNMTGTLPTGFFGFWTGSPYPVHWCRHCTPKPTLGK